MGQQIQIKVRLIGALRIDRFKEEITDYPIGIRVDGIVEQLQIPKRALGIVLINGVHAGYSDSLNEGDTLALLPILGGG